MKIRVGEYLKEAGEGFLDGYLGRQKIKQAKDAVRQGIVIVVNNGDKVDRDAYRLMREGLDARTSNLVSLEIRRRETIFSAIVFSFIGCASCGVITAIIGSWR